MGGMAAAGAGAEAGATIGAFGGPVGATVGGLIGGIGGFIAGSYATEGAQDWAVHQAPDSWQDALGQSDRYQRLQEEQHPYASFIGGLVPYALTMSPGAITAKVANLPENATTFQRIMANPATGRIFGGAAMGGMELGQEEWNGETPNWAKIGVSTGFGLIFNKPTRLGDYLTGTGAGLFGAYRDIETHPTVAQAADMGVMGPGITESTFMGGTEQSEASRATAHTMAANEDALLGKPPEPDLDHLARRMNPEVFQRNDELLTQRDDLIAFIQEQSNPTEDTFNDLNARQYAAEEALRNANPNGPAARGFRAELSSLAEERAEMERRQQAWASEEHEDTPDIALARRHLLDTEHALWDLAPEIRAARRRAADAGGQIEEAPPEAEAPPAQQVSAEETTSANAETNAPSETTAPAVDPKAAIIADRVPKLEAAGMPHDEAVANATMEAHFYETMSRRFEGKLGTPEDLYRTNAATVRGAPRASRGLTDPEKTLSELDARRAPDEDYKNMLSTGTKEPLRPGETWRQRAERFVESTKPVEEEPAVATTGPGERPVIRDFAAIAREEGINAETPKGAKRVRDIQNKEMIALADWQAEQMAAAKGETSTLSQEMRGRINTGSADARAIITFSKDADASTFMHETAHHWLEMMLRWSEHPDAPNSLRDDADILRQALKVQSNEDILYSGNGRKQLRVRRKAHETFATWVEQYLREGVAPSISLARVFEQFKDWLTKIYQSIKSLGVPISDNMRGVLDRMLATEPNRTVHGETRETQPSLAAIHEADAKETPPQQAEAVADRIAAERTTQIAAMPPEIADELARSAGAAESTTETGTGAAGSGAVAEGGEQPGAQSTGGAGSAERGAVGPSGSEAPAKGPGVSGRAAGPERRPNAGAGTGPEQLAPTPADVIQPTESILVGKDGNVRAENITSVQDFINAINESAEVVGGSGPATMGDMLKNADTFYIDPKTIDINKLNTIFGGMYKMEAKVQALRRAVRAQAETVSNLWKEVRDTDSDEAAVKSSMETIRFDMMYSVLSGVTTASGRTTGMAFRNMEGWDKVKDINKLLTDNTGRSLFQTKMIARLGANLDTPGKIAQFIKSSNNRNFGTMLMEYWINGLISGTATHTTYVIGNAILASLKAGPETGVAWALGAIKSGAGREGTRVRLGEVGAQFSAAVREAPAAAQAVLEAYKTGATTLLPGEDARTLLRGVSGEPNLVTPRSMTNAPVTWHEVGADIYGMVQGMRDGLVATGELIKAGGTEGAPTIGPVYSLTGKIPDIAYKGATVLPLGTLARLPSRNVAAIHSGFRAVNYSMEINALAYRQAADEGLAGAALSARVADLRQNPTQEMMEGAVAKSTDLTLMGQGGKLTQQISKFFNENYNVPGIGEVPILKFINPFAHIAGNIMNQALIQRTALGFLSRQVREDLMGLHGNVAQDMAQAKMVVGTTLAITFGGLAAEGLVSGSGPVDPAKRAVWYENGYMPHSVRIGDLNYDIHRLGPLGMLLSISADFYDVSHNISEADGTGAAGAIMHAFTQNILDESFMRGPADLIRAVTESDRYGASYVRNFLSSFMPYSVGMAQAARATDPYTRQARDLLDTIRAHTPGLSEDLYARRDIWGEMSPSRDALISPGLTAIYVNRISHDPVNQALLNLGIGVAQPKREIRNVPLTDQQYDDFSRIAGRMLKMRLDTIVNSPQFQSWSNGEKHYVIEETLRQTREVAGGIVMMQNPGIPQTATQNRKNRFTAEPAPIH
jgi:hypothetical protein